MDQNAEQCYRCIAETNTGQCRNMASCHEGCSRFCYEHAVMYGGTHNTATHECREPKFPRCHRDPENTGFTQLPCESRTGSLIFTQADFHTMGYSRPEPPQTRKEIIRQQQQMYGGWQTAEDEKQAEKRKLIKFPTGEALTQHYDIPNRATTEETYLYSPLPSASSANLPKKPLTGILKTSKPQQQQQQQPSETKQLERHQYYTRQQSISTGAPRQQDTTSSMTTSNRVQPAPFTPQLADIDGGSGSATAKRQRR